MEVCSALRNQRQPSFNVRNHEGKIPSNQQIKPPIKQRSHIPKPFIKESKSSCQKDRIRGKVPLKEVKFISFWGCYWRKVICFDYLKAFLSFLSKRCQISYCKRKVFLKFHILTSKITEKNACF